ncbi:hypothetical protein BJ508DRAFT_69443 [Ascobolus immersus RN42]|uniref:Rhodopsin domain-containing protein n=1 Tax=Ascobolus immersus RN42 TaxID=1160509 RepID=A0A3N4IB29_ASCIM|nr:hypothetical protein BJ508DRAFT_69443 [Ascobolus immersus RN42]
MAEHIGSKVIQADNEHMSLSHAVDQAHGVLLLHAIVPSVALALLIVRNYSRFFFLQVWGWDDIMLNIGWLFSAIMAGLVCLSTEFGMGRHIWDVSRADRVEFLKIVWVCQTVYLLASFFTKTAFFIFFARLASSGTYYTASRILLIFNTLVFISCLFTGLFICLPVPFFWDRSIEGGRCLHIKSYYIANASLNMAMDVTTLLLPAAIVWSSPSISIKKKLSISALFLLGIATCICSILRIPTLARVTEKGNDVTWNMKESSMYSTLELNCAIITGCIPAIKPLITTLLGKATPVGRSGLMKPPVGVKVDSWVLRAHTGSYGASVTAPVIPNSVGRGGSRADHEHKKGPHILLEECLTVEEMRTSRESILATLSRERSGSAVGQLHYAGGVRRSESRTSRGSPAMQSFLR